MITSQAIQIQTVVKVILKINTLNTLKTFLLISVKIEIIETVKRHLIIIFFGTNFKQNSIR